MRLALLYGIIITSGEARGVKEVVSWKHQQSGIQGKNLGSPDEVRSFDKGKMDVVTLGNVTVGLATFEPGWQWSECVKPVAGTDSCQVPHVGYVLSGQIKVVMDDGSEEEFSPDDAVVIPPGHDAWVVGDEPCVMLDFAGADEYAKGARSQGL